MHLIKSVGKTRRNVYDTRCGDKSSISHKRESVAGKGAPPPAQIPNHSELFLFFLPQTADQQDTRVDRRPPGDLRKTPGTRPLCSLTLPALGSARQEPVRTDGPPSGAPPEAPVFPPKVGAAPPGRASPGQGGRGGGGCSSGAAPAPLASPPRSPPAEEPLRVPQEAVGGRAFGGPPVLGRDASPDTPSGRISPRQEEEAGAAPGPRGGVGEPGQGREAAWKLRPGAPQPLRVRRHGHGAPRRRAGFY